MDFKGYLEKFQKAAEHLNKNLLYEKQVEVAVGVVLDSVFLKLYKKSWTNANQDALTAESRIFFSIWINDAAMAEQKTLYNIHAFKLRKLKGYTIESRKFADSFRIRFKAFEHKWPHVSLKFGPLTLMQGWIKNDINNYEEEILKLANNFLEMEYLIDEMLEKFR